MSARPYPFGNGVRPLCCNREPMLRRLALTEGDFLRYECRVCRHAGNSSTDVEIARANWMEITKGPLTH